MKKLVALLLAITLIFTFTACSDGTSETANNGNEPSTNTSENGDDTTVDEQQDTASTYTPVSIEYDSDDLDSGWDSSEASNIILAGDSITLDGSGATVHGSKITITSSGTYVASGALADGQIIVNVRDSGIVKLVLNGVDVMCSTSAPIYIISAEKTVITLADGTGNFVTDGDSYILENAESDEPNAAIFSKDDLTINGSGSLTVNANYNNGIQSKDNLRIVSGDITVNAVNDGIKGRDSIAIKDGNITVYAGGDGLQSNNDEDPERGFVYIEGGTLNITADEDGIQAETGLFITGGSITISSGGGSGNSSLGSSWGNWGNTSDSSTASAKGLKASVDVTIDGGIINIDSSDDSIHSDDSLTIDGGSIVLASGDDGIHSDSTLEINGGDINILESYEGIESSVITINDGDIHLVSSDDGINAAGGADGSSINGRPGQNNFNESADNYLYVNGGYTVIDATGDGLDINGSINMTGGAVIINGPTSNMNGPLDYLGTCKITGGFLVAAGSAGMAQAPSTSSTQYSVIMVFASPVAAGVMIHIESEDGEDILTFTPIKVFQSVVLCSPEIENGSTYVLYGGGSSTGTVTDGLYSGGTYTAGSQVTSFTVSSIVTGLGYNTSSTGGPRR
jgi:hypothetical protein